VKSIFVGNLPWSVTDLELKEKFSEIGGTISARIIKDRISGRSKGFGFVDMEDIDADKAIENLNGIDFNGRKIVVNLARPKESKQ
jgi:RNA recognition motif-containing protein